MRSSSGLRSMPRVGLPSRSSFKRALDQFELLLGVLVVALGLLGQIVDALLKAVEIRQHQFRLDGLDIRERRDLAFDVGDVGIFEAAHHMRDCIDFANIGQKLVAEAFALRRAAHQTGDVHEGQLRRNDLRRLGNSCELIKARVRHRYRADVRLDGAERIVRRLRGRRFSQRVEQGGLADIGQSDDTAFESHNLS